MYNMHEVFWCVFVGSVFFASKGPLKPQLPVRNFSNYDRISYKFSFLLPPDEAKYNISVPLTEKWLTVN